MEKLTDWESWRIWRQSYSLLPAVARWQLPADFRVATWESAWSQADEHAFVLESGKSGRYTFFGKKAVSSIYGNGQQATVCSEDGERSHWGGKPLELVKRWMAPYTTPKVTGAPKFIGGCVGYWGYDVVRNIESLPVIASDDLPFPDYYFMRIEELWILDQQERALICAIHLPIEDADDDQLRLYYESADDRLNEMYRFWCDHVAGVDDAQRIARESYLSNVAHGARMDTDEEWAGEMTRHFPQADYMEAVLRIQDYIRAGDVFQVNLSLRQSRPMQLTPDELYEWLRLVNPSPYMSYFQTPDFQFASVSPELLVSLEQGEVRTRPIAGTRRRGLDLEEEEKLVQELMTNEKERAEHIMLVDLLRNDLGRISSYGSVKVEEFMVIERYSHVMHLVSEIKGDLAASKDGYDVIAAVFPGGTITGAPKIRTMEIIEELEPTRRGPYTGSLGWIDYNGNMEFNIIIRTLLIADNIGHVQCGAGIVIDSDPIREYKESLSKGRALWKAVQYGEAHKRALRQTEEII